MNDAEVLTEPVEINGVKYASLVKFLTVLQFVLLALGLLTLLAGFVGYGWASARESKLMQAEEAETIRMFSANQMSRRLRSDGTVAPPVSNVTSLRLLRQAVDAGRMRVAYQYVIACGLIPLIVYAGLWYSIPRWARTPVEITNEWLMSEDRYGLKEREDVRRELPVGDTSTRLATLAKKWRKPKE